MVTCESSPIPIEHTVEPTFLVGQIRVRVSFFARLPGKYSVDMKINGVAITRGPASITYIPGMFYTCILQGYTCLSTFVVYIMPNAAVNDNRWPK